MRLSLMTFMYELPLQFSGPWDDQKSRTMEELLRLVRKIGFEGVDLTYQTICYMGEDRVRRILKSLGLELSSIICMAHLSDLTLTDEEALAPYVEAVHLAKALDCSHLMPVPGHPVPDTDPEQISGTLIRRLRSLSELAGTEGVVCMIEDDPDLTLGMCAEADITRILRDVPGLKLVYDSANMIVAGEDPVRYFEAVQESVVHMHIKDIAVCEDPGRYRDRGWNGVYYTSAPHGSGLVDFESLFHSIGTSGYQGVLSLEFVPAREGCVTEEELCRIFRYFTALTCRNTPGVNEVPLLSKLIPGPEAQVWKEIRERGIAGVEICILPEESDRIRAYEEEVARKYHNPRPFVRGADIEPYVARIREAGLEVPSCHVMLCEAYPELIRDNVSYLKDISRKTGIRQFVISCSFESADMAGRFLPFLQEAAEALKENDIRLCYHNHHQDSVPLENGKTVMEMIVQQCPAVMLQLDIGWAWYGGMDNLEFMRDHGDRIVSIHLKDLTEDARTRSDAGRFTAIGSGCVNTQEVLRSLTLCRLSPGKLIIDQDASAGDMYDDLEAGVKFVRGSGRLS